MTAAPIPDPTYSKGWIQQQIISQANAAGVPAALALAVADQESGFDQNVVGPAGDTGVFQIIPSTASQLGVDATDVNQNIAGGVRFLADNLSQFGGDPTLAVEAYNCGPGCVQASLNGGAAIPSSTVAYAARVMAKYSAYQKALANQNGNAAASVPPAQSGVNGTLVALGILGAAALIVAVS